MKRQHVVIQFSSEEELQGALGTIVRTSAQPVLLKHMVLKTDRRGEQRLADVTAESCASGESVLYQVTLQLQGTACFEKTQVTPQRFDGCLTSCFQVFLPNVLLYFSFRWKRHLTLYTGVGIRRRSDLLVFREPVFLRLVGILELHPALLAPLAVVCLVGPVLHFERAFVVPSVPGAVPLGVLAGDPSAVALRSDVLVR